MKKTKILVLDDDPLIIEMIGILLRKYNFDPLCVSSGSKALEAFFAATEKGNPFSMAIIDFKTKDKGINVVRLLKEFDTNIDLIALGPISYDLKNFRKYGFDGYLTKPFNIEDFLELIKTFVPLNFQEV